MKKSAAFTLIELLIALAIFAILALTTTYALTAALNTKKRLTESSIYLQQLKLTYLILRQDSMNAIPRPVIIRDMRQAPAFIGNASKIEFTRDGVQSPLEENLTSQRRIIYDCTGGKLIRHAFLRVDSENNTLSQKNILLTDLTHCSFDFLNEKSTWLVPWESQVNTKNHIGELLPRAVRLKISIKNQGNMIILLPFSVGSSHEE